jgi:hypothetical protein
VPKRSQGVVQTLPQAIGSSLGRRSPLPQLAVSIELFIGGVLHHPSVVRLGFLSSLALGSKLVLEPLEPTNDAIVGMRWIASMCLSVLVANVHIHQIMYFQAIARQSAQ